MCFILIIDSVIVKKKQRNWFWPGIQSEYIYTALCCDKPKLFHKYSKHLCSAEYTDN